MQSQEAQRQVELGHQQKLLDFPLLFLSDATLHLQPGDDALVLNDSLLKQTRLAMRMRRHQFINVQWVFLKGKDMKGSQTSTLKYKFPFCLTSADSSSFSFKSISHDSLAFRRHVG